MESAAEEVKIRLEHSEQHKQLMLQQQTHADMVSDESVDSDTVRSEQILLLYKRSPWREYAAVVMTLSGTTWVGWLAGLAGSSNWAIQRNWEALLLSMRGLST
jgi:hypothetical protein